MINKQITIGRSSDCQIVVDNNYDSVSNNHAIIEYSDEGIWLIDMSTNGTIVNQSKVHNKKVQVFYGDTILLAGVYKLEWDTISNYFPLHSRKTSLRSKSDNQNIGRSTVKFKNGLSDSANNDYDYQGNSSKIDDDVEGKNEPTDGPKNKGKWHWLCYVALGVLFMPLVFGAFSLLITFKFEFPEISIATLYALFCVYSLIFRKKKAGLYHGIIMLFLISMGFVAQIYCEDNVQNYVSIDSGIILQAFLNGATTALIICLFFFALLRTILCIKCHGEDAWSLLRNDGLFLNKKIDWTILIILVIIFLVSTVVHMYNIKTPGV